MNLWIRSQDRKCLVPNPEISIINLSDKYIIEGKHYTRLLNLGEYNTEERALEVLDEIQEYLCFDKFNYEDKDRTCYQDCSCYKSDIVMVYEMPKE